nr:phage holin family protein [Sphingobium boeckii]
MFGRLVDDAEHFVRTEVKLYRAEAFHRLESFKWLIAMGAVGALLSFCAVILLLMALVFALAPYAGPAWAAVIVAMLSIACAASLFIAIFAKFHDDMRQEDQADDEADMPA